MLVQHFQVVFQATTVAFRFLNSQIHWGSSLWPVARPPGGGQRLERGFPGASQVDEFLDVAWAFAAGSRVGFNMWGVP